MSALQVTERQMQMLVNGDVRYLLLPTRRTSDLHLKTTGRYYCCGKHTANDGYVTQYPATLADVQRLGTLGYERVVVQVLHAEKISASDFSHLWDCMLVYNPKETGDALLLVESGSDLPFGLPHTMYLMRVGCEDGVPY